MPYPNEHACRLNDPGKYSQIRRKNCDRKSGGKCIDVIYGRRKTDGKSDNEIKVEALSQLGWEM